MRRSVAALATAVLLFGIVFLPAAVSYAEDDDSRHAVPDPAAQKAAAKLVADVFREDYEQAKTPGDKSALAKKMLELAGETEDDPAARYVLLRIARDISVQVTDVELTLRAVDSLDDNYRVDGFLMKIDMLSKIAKTKRARDKNSGISAHLNRSYSDATEKERYELAERIAGIELSLARTSRDKAKIAHAVSRQKAAARLQASYLEVEQALEKLKEQPDDPDANLIVGEYRCFIRGSWAEGLPALALCGDESLRTVAKLDVAGAESVSDQVNLGDTWWALAEDREDKGKTGCLSRAAFWYEKARESGVQGLMKAKVDKRLKEIAEATTKPPPQAPSRPPATAKPVHETFKVSAKTFIGYLGPPARPDSGLRAGAKTNVWITKGQTVAITATGRVKIGPFKRHNLGPEALNVAIGEVGKMPLQLFAGKDIRFRATHSGFLFLGLDDGPTRDNSGSLVVEVNVR